ncbi:MAG: DnaJ domain-containing protein [Acidobacteriota bacterium]
MASRDPRGYYAVLNVSPDASAEEIRLSYLFLKQSYQKGRRPVPIGKVQAAYETLSDIQRRAQYGARPRRAAPTIRTGFGSLRLLAVLAGVFLMVVLVVAGPRLKASLTHFTPGETLIWSESRRVLGTVTEYQADYSFSNGSRAPAYRIRPRGEGESLWYPARDLVRLCRPL